MVNTCRRSRALIVGAAVLLLLGFFGQGRVLGSTTAVDLIAWTAESYPAVSGFGPGVWTVAPDGLSVFQSVNGQPTLFHSDFNAFNTMVEGKIRVETTGDDDFIGFALGFEPGDSSNPLADYLLIDWKQGNQGFDFGSPSCTPRSTAPRGLAVSRVSGVPTADEFWGHTNFDSPACSDLSNGLTELARGTNLGSTGWTDFREYAFRFEFNSTSLKVFVDDILEIDIAGSFSDGRLAFYNFSQSHVRYSGFEVAPLVDDVPPRCEVIGVNIAHAAPPTNLLVEVEDAGSGLDAINGLVVSNATVNIPAFSVGTNAVIQVVADKIDESKRSRVEIQAIDVAGNSSTCDPVLATLTRDSRTLPLTGIPSKERYLTISPNGPVRSLVMANVNGRWFQVRSADQRSVTIDLGSAMTRGSDNTVTLWASNDTTILLADAVPKTTL